MNNKIYARQIAPEYQESPLMMFDDYPDNVSIFGNRSFNDHIFEAHKTVRDALEGDDFEDIGTEYGWYKTATEYFNDVLKPEHKKAYSARDVGNLRKLFKEYGDYSTDDKIESAVLTIYTGTEYTTGTIRGCCQSDWQNATYPASIDISYLECEYFNTGTEWIIHEGDDAPESPEDVDGYGMYCYTYNPAEEIAREGGVDVADVVLYEFDGYTRTPKYTEVTA